jgi:hypothetical protein
MHPLQTWLGAGLIIGEPRETDGGPLPPTRREVAGLIALRALVLVLVIVIVPVIVIGIPHPSILS